MVEVWWLGLFEGLGAVLLERVGVFGGIKYSDMLLVGLVLGEGVGCILIGGVGGYVVGGLGLRGVPMQVGGVVLAGGCFLLGGDGCVGCWSLTGVPAEVDGVG